MKTIKTLLFALVMVAFAACDKGSGSGFNPDVCEKLAEMIEDDEDLDENEYSQMLDQYEAMANIVCDKADEYEGDDVKLEKYFTSNREGKKIYRYGEMFSEYLKRHKEDLTKSQQKRFNEIKRKLEKKYDEYNDNYDYEEPTYEEPYYEEPYYEEPYYEEPCYEEPCYEEPCYEAPAEAAAEAAAEAPAEAAAY